jgi:hypothetical protein
LQTDLQVLVIIICVWTVHEDSSKKCVKCGTNSL